MTITSPVNGAVFTDDARFHRGAVSNATPRTSPVGGQIQQPDANYPPPWLYELSNRLDTGPRRGVSLVPQSAHLFTSAPGQVISGVDMNGFSIIIQHPNVEVKDSLLKVGDTNNLAILAGGDNAYVHHCEVDGLMTGGTGIQMKLNSRFEYLDIHGLENGVNVSANGGIFRRCWIHDMFHDAVAHTDCMQFDPDASNCLIEWNVFEPINFGDTGGTGCINYNNEVGATNTNMRAQYNWIDGRGSSFCCYFPRFAGWSNIVHVNNWEIPAHIDVGGGNFVDRYHDSAQNTSLFKGNINPHTGSLLTTAS